MKNRSSDTKKAVDAVGVDKLKNFLIQALDNDAILHGKFISELGNSDSITIRDFYKEANAQFASTFAVSGYGSSTSLGNYADEIEAYEKTGDAAEAARMYCDVAKGIVNNVVMLDNSDAEEVYDFEQCMMGIARCMNKIGKHKAKQSYIRYMFSLLQDNYGYWDSCEDALEKMCTLKEDLQYWGRLKNSAKRAKAG